MTQVDGGPNQRRGCRTASRGSGVKLMGAFNDAPLMVQRPQAGALRRPPGSRLSRGHWLSQLDVIVARADRSGRKGLGGTMNEVTFPTARIGWYDAVSQADERWFKVGHRLR